MSTLPITPFNPQQPDMLGTYARLMQIKNAQQEMQQRAALAPGQQQLQQAQLTGAQQQNQIGAADVQLKQQQVKDQQILGQLYQKFAQKTPTNGQGTTPATGPTGYDFDGLKQAFVQAGGSAAGVQQINQMQAGNAELAKKLADAGDSTIKLEQSKNSALNDAIETLQAIPDVPSRMKVLPDILNTLGKQGVDVSKLYNQTPSDENLASAQATLGMHQQVITDATKIADLQKATQDADPVRKLSTPEALAAPGAKASIQALINDPTTKPQDVPRLQALLPKADIAANQVANMKQRDARAQQIVNQGDPDSAGKLLASRTMTIEELKLRNATPDFMMKAVQAAQKYDPSFKAPEAAAQAKIAGSASNQQFFGNTDSLLVNGGTLDQLDAAGKALGNTQIPAYNTIANWNKAALGQGPQAAFAAAALGVADDYSKVMSGGQGSDTSRQQALDIIGKNQSPEGRSAAIQQIRKSVGSQRQGRVGQNPYMRDMYPEPNAGGTVTMKAPNGQTKQVPADQVEHFKSLGATVIQ